MRIRTTGELGLRIRDRRLELGWSQAQLADRLGTTRQWVVSLEQGNPGAALGQVLQALAVLGLNLDVRGRRTRKDPGTASPRRPRTVTDEEFRTLLDLILERALDPEGAAHDPPTAAAGDPGAPLDALPPRTPLRRREEE